MNKSGPTSTGHAFNPIRKRPQRGPIFFYIGAAIFVFVGLYFLFNALIGPGKPISNMLATDTPTPTVTYTPTSTSTPTSTPTETPTATITNTPTPSAPFTYVVQENDNLVFIAEKYQLAEDGILLILDLNPAIAENKGIIFPGQQLWIPNPGMRRDTPTPIPGDLPRGTKLQYTILPGDTLAGIAAKFNSTVDAILAENKNLADPNLLTAYEVLIVPVNMVTPTATRSSTSTPITATATFPVTPTKTP
jgi:LysM repeat protein